MYLPNFQSKIASKAANSMHYPHSLNLSIYILMYFGIKILKVFQCRWCIPQCRYSTNTIRLRDIHKPRGYDKDGDLSKGQMIGSLEFFIEIYICNP